MEAIKQALAPIFIKMSDRIAAVYLFGSRARGDAGPTSDVDLAVLLHDSAGNCGLELRLDLYADCCRALKRNDIDIVILNSTRNLFLLEEVVNRGVVLYQDDIGLREEFEVNVMHDFIDFRDHRKRVMGV